jgi:hypothetical protein
MLRQAHSQDLDDHSNEGLKLPNRRRDFIGPCGDEMRSCDLGLTSRRIAARQSFMAANSLSLICVESFRSNSG